MKSTFACALVPLHAVHALAALAALASAGLFVACSATATSPPDTAISPTEAGATADTGVLGEPTEDGGGPSPSTAPCAAFAEARCDREATCRENAFTLEHGSRAACVAKKTAACNALRTAPGSTYAEADALACAKALPSYACSDMVLGHVPDACLPPAGTFALDASCAEDAQCASGVCLFEDSAPCGKCRPKSPAGQLQRCSSTAQCPATEGCTSISTTVMRNGVCRTIVGVGDPCQNAHCDADSYCVSGICSPAARLGKACGPFAGPCDPRRGLTCDIGLANPVCIALARTFAADEECDSTGACELGYTCTAFPGIGGVCVALPEEGDSCESTCAPPARCAGIGTGTARECVIETPATCSK